MVVTIDEKQTLDELLAFLTNAGFEMENPEHMLKLESPLTMNEAVSYIDFIERLALQGRVIVDDYGL